MQRFKIRTMCKRKSNCFYLLKHEQDGAVNSTQFQCEICQSSVKHDVIIAEFRIFTLCEVNRVSCHNLMNKLISYRKERSNVKMKHIKRYSLWEFYDYTLFFAFIRRRSTHQQQFMQIVFFFLPSNGTIVEKIFKFQPKRLCVVVHCGSLWMSHERIRI